MSEKVHEKFPSRQFKISGGNSFDSVNKSIQLRAFLSILMYSISCESLLSVTYTCHAILTCGLVSMPY